MVKGKPFRKKGGELWFPKTPTPIHAILMYIPVYPPPSGATKPQAPRLFALRQCET